MVIAANGLEASALAEDVARCLAAGMDSVLTKPFKPAQLGAPHGVSQR